MNGTGARRGRGGYTLVALLVGMTVASILIAAVLPLASAQAQREREAELIFRGLQYSEGIRVFRRRFGRYPESLEVLVSEHYIRKVPIDPFTKSPDTWELVFEEPDSADAASEEAPGIIDVKSGAPGTALDGTAYNTW